MTQTLTKGRLAYAKSPSDFIEFQYNPSAFTDDLGVIWNEIAGAGMSYPLLQYGGGKTRAINFELFLDDIEKPGILRQTVNFLHGFLPPARTVGYQFTAPTPILFAFGWMVKECVLESMPITYNYFSPSLQPLMCTINITLKVIQ